MGCFSLIKSSREGVCSLGQSQAGRTATRESSSEDSCQENRTFLGHVSKITWESIVGIYMYLIMQSTRATILIKLLFHTHSHQLSPKLLWQRYSTFPFSWNLLRARAKTVTWHFCQCDFWYTLFFHCWLFSILTCRACLGLYNPRVAS